MNNNDDDEKKVREQIEKLLNEKNNKNRGLKLGYFLHRNFSIHILLTIIVNLFTFGIVMGFSMEFFKIAEMNTITAFFIAVLMYSVFETALKIVSISFFFKIVVTSFGLLFIGINLGLFWIIDLMMEDFSFHGSFTNLLAFTLLFTMVRTLFTVYVRKTRWIQGG